MSKEEIKQETAETPQTDETPQSDVEERDARELQAEIEDSSFDYGDLILKCHKCGREQIMDTKISNGIQITLLTNTKSFLKLKCDECDNYMELKFTETTPPEGEEKPETMSHEVTKEDVEINKGEDLKEGEEIEIPKEKGEDENVQEESNKE